MTYVIALIFSGIIWLIAGFSLFANGLQYSLLSVQKDVVVTLSTHFKLLSLFLFGSVCGYLCGRFFFTKGVVRYMRHIAQYEEPLGVREVVPRFSLSFIFWICLIGFGVAYLPIPPDAIATVELTVGVALLYGTALFFQKARLFKNELP